MHPRLLHPTTVRRRSQLTTRGWFRAAIAFILLALAPALTARAADKSWLGPDGGNWSTGFYWDGSTMPGHWDNVFLGNHSPAPGTLNLNVNFNVAYSPGGELSSLTLDSSALGAYMILNQSSASSVMSAYTETVGDVTSDNTYNQSAGSNIAGALYIGHASNQNYYNLSGTGSLSVGGFVSIGGSGQGALNQTGGAVDFTGSYDSSAVSIGQKAGGYGVYNLSAGTAKLYDLYIGALGTGVFNQSGGNATVNYFKLGSYGTGTGTYTITAGHLSITDAIDIGGGGGSGTFNLNGGTVSSPTISLNAGGVLNVQGGAFSGAPALNMSGGTLHVNGVNLTLNRIIGYSGTIDSGSAGNGTLTTQSASDGTYDGTLKDGTSGKLSLVKSGSAMWALGGVNTYTGTTTLQTGVLKANVAPAFSPGSTFVINGGTLDVNSLNVTLGALAGAAGQVPLGATTLTVGGNNASTTFAGALTGTGTIKKIGTGQWSLAGTPFTSTYSGTIDVQDGSLKTGATDGIPTNASVNLSGSGAALNVSSNQTLASLAGGGTSSINFGAGSTLSVGASNASTALQGDFSGTGTLKKVGTGTLTIGGGAADTAANLDSFMGVTVAGGIVALNKADGTNAVAGPVVVSGGTLALNRGNQISDGSPLLMTGGIFNMNGFSETIGGLSGAAGAAIATGGGTLTVNQSTDGVYGGALSGPGALVKTGPAALSIGSAGNFGGSFTVNGGRLELQGPVSATDLIANSGGTLRFTNATVNLNGGSVKSNAAGAAEYSGATITNGFLRGPGTHTILPGPLSTFSGVNTYNSSVLAQNGPAKFVNFTNGGTVHNNAPLTYDGGSNSASGVINVNSSLTAQDFANDGAINVNGGGTFSSQDLVNTGTINATGGATTTLALTGNGALNVGGGVGGSSAVSVTKFTQGSVTINNGGALSVLPNPTRYTNTVTALGIAGSGTLDLANHALLADNVATPEASIRKYLKNGYNADATGIGNWLGTGGITSSDAITAHNGPNANFKISIGYVNGAYANDPLISGPIPGQELLPANKILVRPALYGDFNLDGKVDDTDLAIFSGLGQYNSPSPKFGWLGGDLNHDGHVDDTDLLIFSGAGNYNGPAYGATPALTAAAAAATAATRADHGNDGTLDFVYDPATGDLKIKYDGDPNITAANPLQVIRFKSAGGHFIPANFNASGFSNTTTDNSTLNGTILGGGSLPDGYDLGNVLPASLALADLTSDLTLQWNVSGGGFNLKSADIVPEPVTLGMLAVTTLSLTARRRRTRS
jgi:fibronectin-binding autotransporter adhesin